MATDTESFNNELYDLLKVRGYKPVPLNSQNQRVKASQEADVIEFQFNKDGEDYGKVWVSIDDANNIIVYYSEEQQESPSDVTPGAEYNDTWTGFLKHLKQWAQRRQLSFELSNKDRLGDDMRQRDYYKMKEKLGESYHPMGKKASYNDAVPNVKIILQHNRSLEEGEARFRNVARIFLENQDGERFLAPTTRPGIARVYARHIAEGGLPNDEKWNHIKSVCEDYNKMAGFVRATRNKQFNESAQTLVQEGLNHYNNIRETLHKLTTHKGYHNYFESYTPTLMEGDGEDISEMFMSSSMDPRIEAAMPILSRLHKPINEMDEVEALSEWADSIISEKLETDTPAEKTPAPAEPAAPVVKARDKEHEALIKHYTELLGPVKGRKKADQAYTLLKKKEKEEEPADDYSAGDTKLQKYEKKAKKKLSKRSFEEGEVVPFKKKDDEEDWDDDSWIPSVEDFEQEERIRNRKRNPANDVDEGIVATIKKAFNSRSGEANKRKWQELGQALRAKSPEEARRHAKASDRYYSIADGDGPFGKGPLKKKEVEEDLDANQKRVGQLGPTEKVKNNNIGKLVGANESNEIDPELARIIEMAKFKR